MEILLKVAFGIGLMMLIGMIYFAPYRLARRRGHPQAGSILILNLFVGFTFIGWVIAYAWAHSHIETPKPHREGPQPPQHVNCRNVVPFHQGGSYDR